jgi:hypothetical protein
VRLKTVPLGVYFDVQSPWGLLDTLGGYEEWSEDWYDGEYTRRLSRRSNNTTTGWTFDEINVEESSRPRHSLGLRIASAVPSRADLDQNWIVDWFDVSVFMKMYIADDLAVDFNDDQQLDINDVLMFLELMGR